MRAVHFGAGAIGRGLVAPVLTAAGFEVVLVDTDPALVEALSAAGGYSVVDTDGARLDIRDIRILDANARAGLIASEIATADLVTTATGAAALPEVAALLAAGLTARMATGQDAIDGRLPVLACENAVGASAALAALVGASLIEAQADQLQSAAVFVPAAVDRIVPAPRTLDVLVEPGAAWWAERVPGAPLIDGIELVPDLGAVLERKRLTLGIAHAAAAYLGAAAGFAEVAEAAADAQLAERLREVLAETAPLIEALGFGAESVAALDDRTLDRLRNHGLHDAVDRVGRRVLTKLGRDERIVAPAMRLAERGLPVDALLDVVAAALRFAPADDPDAAELQRMLRAEPPAVVLAQVTGVPSSHPLHPALLAAFESAAVSAPLR